MYTRKCHSNGRVKPSSIYIGGFVLHNFIEPGTFVHCIRRNIKLGGYLKHSQNDVQPPPQKKNIYIYIYIYIIFIYIYYIYIYIYILYLYIHIIFIYIYYIYI